MPETPRLLIILLTALLLVFGAVACGDDDDGESIIVDATPGTVVDGEEPGRSDGGEDLTPGPESSTLALAGGNAAVGQTADVVLNITGFPEPGLGAWTIDITHDPSIVSVGECAPREGSVCNEAFDEGIVRIAGAVAEGLTGDTLLLTLTYRCEAAGTSPIEVEIDVLADATIGAPDPVPANVQNAEVVCA